MVISRLSDTLGGYFTGSSGTIPRLPKSFGWKPVNTHNRRERVVAWS